MVAASSLESSRERTKIFVSVLQRVSLSLHVAAVEMLVSRITTLYTEKPVVSMTSEDILSLCTIRCEQLGTVSTSIDLC